MEKCHKLLTKDHDVAQLVALSIPRIWIPLVLSGRYPDTCLRTAGLLVFKLFRHSDLSMQETPEATEDAQRSAISLLPVELWHQVFASIDRTHERWNLPLLCQVCKLFNALVQPLVFQKIECYRLLNPNRPDVAEVLSGYRGEALGANVKEAEVDVCLVLHPMCNNEAWQPVEVRRARRDMKSHLLKVFNALDVCRNLSSLAFKLGLDDLAQSDHPDHPYVKIGGYFDAEGFDSILPKFDTTDLLALPCLAFLRSLCLSSSRVYPSSEQYSCKAFDLEAFGHLIAAAVQLEEVRLLEFEDEDLFAPLQARLANQSSIACNLRQLYLRMQEPESDWDPGEADDTIDCFFGHLKALPSVASLALDLNNMTDILSSLADSDYSMPGILTLKLESEGTNNPTIFAFIASLFPSLRKLDLMLYNGIRNHRMRSPAESMSGSLEHVQELSVEFGMLDTADDLAWLRGDGGGCGYSSPWGICDGETFPNIRRFRMVLFGMKSQQRAVQVVNAAEKGSLLLPARIQVEIIARSPDWSSGLERRYRRSIRDASGWQRFN